MLESSRRFFFLKIEKMFLLNRSTDYNLLFLVQWLLTDKFLTNRHERPTGQKGSKLGQPCPKVRLSHDRMVVTSLNSHNLLVAIMSSLS
jgi:hypothetical protein